MGRQQDVFLAVETRYRPIVCFAPILSILFRGKKTVVKIRIKSRRVSLFLLPNSIGIHPCSYTMDLLKAQLVGPLDGDFAETRYSFSPAAQRGIRLRLATRLSAQQCSRLQMKSTPLMSLFGLYLHTPSGLIVVHCADKTSFSVRMDKFELADVVSRSERIEQYKTGQLVEGMHYDKGLTAEMVEGFYVMALVDAISSIGGRYEVEDIKPPMAVMPLLPVFIGYNRSGFVESVNYNKPDWKAEIKKRARYLFLHQVIYNSGDSFKVMVELEGVKRAGFGKLMESALARPSSDAEFVSDVTLAVQKRMPSSLHECPPAEDVPAAPAERVVPAVPAVPAGVPASAVSEQAQPGGSRSPTAATAAAEEAHLQQAAAGSLTVVDSSQETRSSVPLVFEPLPALQEQTIEPQPPVEPLIAELVQQQQLRALAGMDDRSASGGSAISPGRVVHDKRAFFKRS